MSVITVFSIMKASYSAKIFNFIRAASKGRIIWVAIKVSLVVGTVLNLINQSDAIFGEAMISQLHLALNYLVPFCVSAYSGTSNQMNQQKI